MRVGLFDSGIGGLTVLKALMDKYPCNDYIYYGDTLNLPYGSKSKEELIKLAKHNVDFLLSKRVDVIIIACGTVSSNCLMELKEYTDTPIYDILSPTISYLNNSNYNDIGVLATEATIKSHIFKNNINKNIYEIPAPKLVPLIENNELANINDILNEYLKDYLDKIDILVLGCTHYPLLLPYLKEINCLDMASLIKLDNHGNGKRTIYFSLLDDKVIENTKKILECEIDIRSSN